MIILQLYNYITVIYDYNYTLCYSYTIILQLDNYITYIIILQLYNYITVTIILQLYNYITII